MPAHLRPSVRTAAAVLLALSLAACGGGAKPGATPAPSDSTTAQAPRPREEMAQTSAVTTIEGSDMRKVQVQRIEEYLQGRVPGLTVFRGGNGEYTMRIRGATKLSSGTPEAEEPLLVIDGIAVQQGGLSSALMSLDPRDIAQVRVLKDASATAIYGSRGANGVLVIRTVGAAKRP
jgi:TonB-dependent SusC/RagA subfamily outer membrane receptor